MGVARADDMDCPTGDTEEEMDCPTGAALIVMDCPTGAALACVDFAGVFAVFFGAVFLTTILAGADAEGACCVGGVLAGVKVNGVGSTLIRGCRGGACG